MNAVLLLVGDLSLELPREERYQRLLGAVQTLFGCDACAVLQLDGDTLLPLAVSGLSRDTLGRRFRLAAHPRLAALMAQAGATRFDADSPLPDPYDGLLSQPEPEPGGDLAVHDCMGCPLTVNGRPWGLLTLDALQAGTFDESAIDTLTAFAGMAAATVAAAERLDLLARDLRHEREQAERLRLLAGVERPARLLTGDSPAIEALRHEIRTVGPSDLTVLIRGETGTGKELVAAALHAASARSKQAMVVVNCAALPENLVESELFGHVRGAFSGATADRRGKFEWADGGTLFLDEVGELSVGMQAKLLRVMQSGQLQRVGSDREHHVDVRIVAATNRDLAEEVRQGRCRADFYHRLSVFPLQVPPLRERGGDVLLIAGFFLEENRSRLGLRALRLAPDAEAFLSAYHWPGNIRELEHLVARSALRAAFGKQHDPRGIVTLRAADLAPLAGETMVMPPPAQTGPATAAPTLRDALAQYERQLIEQSLQRNRNNWAATARELKVDRANLGRSARRLGLKD
jgi:anaerobic nitric oxide reductase transcription regulator